MSSMPPQISLGSLDEPRPATVDPAIWARNLAALAAAQPALAAELRSVELPGAWRTVVALDGQLTYRVEPAGAPAEWLGGTAAPGTRAAGLLGQFDPAGKNPALACCGTGAELELLLRRLPVHYAVFVFESDPRVLAAVLRIRDFSADISAGRCLLVPPGREAAWLAEVLAAHPGLLPPGDIVLPDLAPAERVRELTAVCARVMQDVMSARTTRLAALKSAATTRIPEAATAGRAAVQPAAPRLALLALSARPRDHAVAAQLERAARRLGWEVCTRTITGPRDVHPLTHCEALTAFRPELTLALNHPANPLPVCLPGALYAWLLDEQTAATAKLHEDVHYLAASPTVAAVLRAREAAHATDWFFGCDAGIAADVRAEAPATAADQPAARSSDRPAIVLVADLPDARAAACGIMHSTHAILWDRLSGAVDRVWETPDVLAPEKLLVRVEREAGLEVRDTEVRAGLLRLLERVLIPARIAVQVAHELGREGPVLALGHGWESAAIAGPSPLAREFTDGPPAAAGRNVCGCVVVGPDPLGPALLAAALGWPLLLHDRGGRTLARALGGVLQPGRDCTAFVDRAGLRGAARALRQNEAKLRRRAAQTRDRLLAEHTYDRRLPALWALVRAPENRNGPDEARNG